MRSSVGSCGVRLSVIAPTVITYGTLPGTPTVIGSGPELPAEATWLTPAGGLFVWATLPDFVDTRDLLAQALHARAAADRFLDGLHMSAQTDIFLLQLLRFEGPLHGQQQLRQR